MKNLTIGLALFLSLGSADAKATESLSSIGNRDSDDSVRVIGNLPYSNQWVYERSSSFLYLNYDSETLASGTINVSHFQTQYSSPRFNLLSLDFFSRILTLADPLGSSFLRKFSFWGRYKVGFGIAEGSLVDLTGAINLPAEKSSLLVLEGGVALTLVYDWSEWVQPFIGVNFKPYYFRNTSSMTTAETEGSANLYGPSIGVHLPVLFSHKGSLFAELHQDIPATSDQIFTKELAGDFGAGITF